MRERDVGKVLADKDLTVAGKFLVLVEQAPRCACGGNCQILEYLAEQLRRIEVKEAGWQT